MTSVAFDAMVVSGHDPDEGSVLVAFSDDPAEPSRYLLLQRSLHPGDQDRALGHDAYHIEWCGQEHSMYGGIEEFALGVSTARVRFSAKSVESLGGVSELIISFSLAPGELESLSQGLQVIFAGSGCFTQANA